MQEERAGSEQSANSWLSSRIRRRLFAEKYFGPAKSLGIRTALVIGHPLRLLVLAPRQLACGSAGFQAERHALVVQLGFAAPASRR